MVQRLTGMQFFQPGLDPGIIVAFQTEPHIDAAGEFLAGGGHHVHVFLKLLRSHPHIGGKSVGQRAMAGEDDPAQAARLRLGGVFGRFSVGMFAQRRVRVGLVEQLNGHSSILAEDAPTVQPGDVTIRQTFSSVQKKAGSAIPPYNLYPSLSPWLME